MTIEQVKEQLSNSFIGILAVSKKFVLDKPGIDLGVDYTLRKTFSYPQANGKTRYAYDNRYIDIQLKATTEKGIEEGVSFIKYDLDAKNYNDLIERQQNGIAPLVLILFILPEHELSWVDIDPQELRLRKQAYWYVPPIGAFATPNMSKKRIEIPKENLLGLDCFETIHKKFYS